MTSTARTPLYVIDDSPCSPILLIFGLRPPVIWSKTMMLDFALQLPSRSPLLSVEAAGLLATPFLPALLFFEEFLLELQTRLT